MVPDENEVYPEFSQLLFTGKTYSNGVLKERYVEPETGEIYTRDLQPTGLMENMLALILLIITISSLFLIMLVA